MQLQPPFDVDLCTALRYYWRVAHVRGIVLVTMAMSNSSSNYALHPQTLLGLLL